MAVYKSVKGVGKTKSSLYNILKYVGSQNEKEKDDRVYKTTGINVSDDYKKAFVIQNKNSGKYLEIKNAQITENSDAGQWWIPGNRPGSTYRASARRSRTPCRSSAGLHQCGTLSWHTGRSRLWAVWLSRC